MSHNLTRRRLLRNGSYIAAAAACPPAFAQSVTRSRFGAESTAEEVTEGLDLSGKTAVVTGCNSGIGYETGPKGEIVTVEQSLQPGETGRLAYRGTEWTVVNTSEQAFEQGQHVQISSVDGLTLKLDTVKTHE